MYRRRLLVLIVLTTGVFLVLGVRLAHLQLVRGEDLRRMYEQSIRSVDVLPAVRGQIMDRHGRILAVDRPCKDLCLEYRLLTDHSRSARTQIRRIARQHGLSLSDANALFRERRAATWAMARKAAEETGVDLARQCEQIIAKVRAYRANAGVPDRKSTRLNSSHYS